MTGVARLLVIVASRTCCRPNCSSIVATGSRPPYGVRFLPSKSYGVEAPILLGSGCVAWIACLAALFRLCFFPRLTIWVTSLGFCAAELLPPHPRFYSMFSGVTNWSTSAQPSRIRSRVHNSGVTVPPNAGTGNQIHRLQAGSIHCTPPGGLQINQGSPRCGWAHSLRDRPGRIRQSETRRGHAFLFDCFRPR